MTKRPIVVGVQLTSLARISENSRLSLISLVSMPANSAANRRFKFWNSASGKPLVETWPCCIFFFQFFSLEEVIFWKKVQNNLPLKRTLHATDCGFDEERIRPSQELVSARDELGFFLSCFEEQKTRAYLGAGPIETR